MTTLATIADVLVAAMAVFGVALYVLILILAVRHAVLYVLAGWRGTRER